MTWIYADFKTGGNGYSFGVIPSVKNERAGRNSHRTLDVASRTGCERVGGTVFLPDCNPRWNPAP
ncbi:MAG: hypothetical protein LBT83_06500 [Tannerella sp.]|jgi:hypothetical protein|nr:hypothetical protein [Tannerella sp.]